MTSHQITTFPPNDSAPRSDRNCIRWGVVKLASLDPPNDDESTTSYERATSEPARRTRRPEVPTSLDVGVVVDRSPRLRGAHHLDVEDAEEQSSPVPDDDDEGSDLESGEDGSPVGSPSSSPLTLDLPDCFDVSSRVEEGSRLLNSAEYRRLVHPLDRGMLLSFVVSVIYLAAASRLD